MPARQVPWRALAEHFAGAFQFSTSLSSSSFVVDAIVEGMPVQAKGTSVPYRGGHTSISVSCPMQNIDLHVCRTHPMDWLGRQFLLPAVSNGVPGFDVSWSISAKRDSQAQYTLGPTERKCLERVSAQEIPFATHPPQYSHYKFAIRKKRVTAIASHFEQNTDRLIAAVHAAIALATRPTSLLREWQSLAQSIDGTLTANGAWQTNGRTRISLAVLGKVIRITPCIEKTGFYSDRLRTRVSVANHTGEEFSIPIGYPHRNIPQPLKKSIASIRAIVFAQKAGIVYLDLDGNVTAPARLQIAAQCLAQYTQDSVSQPYR